jgi:hypothetical protein
VLKVEGLAGVGADRRDGREADHDDQRQHDGIFHRRRTVFAFQKIGYTGKNSGEHGRPPHRKKRKSSGVREN